MMPDTHSVIEGGYLRDILAQPRALEDTLAGFELAETVRRLDEGRFRRIVLTGMGASYWALHPLHLDLLQQGRASFLLETSELIHSLPAMLNSHTLLIAVSQSGRSAETVRLLDVKAPDCFTLALTNTADSPLALRADVVVLTHAGEEFTVSCKTYVTALLALKWVADSIAGRSLTRSRDELSQAAPAVAAYLHNWREYVQAAEAELTGARHLFVLGRGASLATAGIAGLIVKESAHFHAEGMSAAQFRHGPFEMVDRAVYALVFAGDPTTALLNARLVRDIVQAGGRASLAGEDAEPGIFRLPPVPASVRPIVEILPVQMITLALAAMVGREAGKFERASKVTITE
ncbi:MAG: SIS domain-containing protein [Acidobacteriia bacterium]|nr:SIS domain-containing protein [Terriglobia bacterium]